MVTNKLKQRLQKWHGLHQEQKTRFFQQGIIDWQHDEAKRKP